MPRRKGAPVRTGSVASSSDPVPRPDSPGALRKAVAAAAAMKAADANLRRPGPVEPRSKKRRRIASDSAAATAKPAPSAAIYSGEDPTCWSLACSAVHTTEVDPEDQRRSLYVEWGDEHPGEAGTISAFAEASSAATQVPKFANAAWGIFRSSPALHLPCMGRALQSLVLVDEQVAAAMAATMLQHQSQTPQSAHLSRRHGFRGHA